MYTFSGFSKHSNAVVQSAITQAQNFGHIYIGTEHLMLALLAEKDGVASRFLPDCTLLRCGMAALIEAQIGRGKKTHLTPQDFTPNFSKTLDYAAIEAKTLATVEIEPEHLLGAILENKNATATKMLSALGVEPLRALRECQRITGHSSLPFSSFTPRTGGAKSTTRTVEKYTRDFTDLASNDRFDPVIGRDDELARVVQILARRQKNNPCLVGEAGVGKTAVIEGLAQKISSGDVPDALRGKRVLALDLTALVAGTKYRGDFEERFHNLLNDVSEMKNIILFIDELHVIMGAGAAEGGIDACGILKPLLARGELQLIGATTLAEYRKYIEKDGALARRFGAVTIEEPSHAIAVKILTALAPRYEQFHGVTISKEAIEAAVTLSARYLPERFLPDKAIDLLDEACAATRVLHHTGADKTAPLITKTDIAAICAKQSGVPVEKLSGEARKNLAGLEEHLSQKVVGQPQAIHVVAGALQRAGLGLADTRRPIGSFLLLGPTGVGKTALAKALAESCFGSEKALIRFDMSEYMEQHTVSRLLGAPPGYVGHGEGGQLTEAVRRHPYSVVLFDEIEKAHPDIYNVLLQILEDGRLTDGEGAVVNFSNALILLTSNLGAKYLACETPLGFGTNSQIFAERDALRAAKETFRPELIGRLDELVIFHTLSETSLLHIGEILLAELELRAAESGIALTHTSQATEILVKEAYQPAYGARPLRRAITRRVGQCLADKILSASEDAPTAYTLAVQDGALCLNAPALAFA